MARRKRRRKRPTPRSPWRERLAAEAHAIFVLLSSFTGAAAFTFLLHMALGSVINMQALVWPVCAIAGALAVTPKLNSELRGQPFSLIEKFAICFTRAFPTPLRALRLMYRGAHSVLLSYHAIKRLRKGRSPQKS